MGFIYLVRHAQAGTRDNYDVLSEMGERQAKLLGEYLASQHTRISEIQCGGMKRQQLTAEIVSGAFAGSGLEAPDVKSDGRWNEFSLASLYRAFAERMSVEDPAFAADFKEMQDTLKLEPHTTRGAVGRCDVAMIRAWIDNRYRYDGESWSEFQSRVKSVAGELDDSRADSVAVFTSATPIAILTGEALGIQDARLLRLLGVIYNSSVTMLKRFGDGLRLFSYNGTPHLTDELRTFR